MQVSELRELTAQELDEKLASLRQQLFELRRKQAIGQLEHGEEIKAVRKDIAKAETVKRERALQIER